MKYYKLESVPLNNMKFLIYSNFQKLAKQQEQAASTIFERQVKKIKYLKQAILTVHSFFMPFYKAFKDWYSKDNLSVDNLHGTQ